MLDRLCASFFIQTVMGFKFTVVFKAFEIFYCGKSFVLTVAKTAYTHVPVNEQLSVLSSILTVFVVQSTCFDFVRSEEKFVITIP